MDEACDKIVSILIFGPPGSGKGTLAKFLASAGSQYHLSSQDILRSMGSHSSPSDLYLSSLDQEAVLPDEATIHLWKEYVDQLIAKQVFCPERQDLLLEGIPRTLKQIKLLEQYIAIKHIIVLDMQNTQELMKRLTRQAKAEGSTCEFDTNTVSNKISLYQKESEQILSYFPKHLLSVVNADQRPLEVLRDVLVKLSHLLSRKLF